MTAPVRHLVSVWNTSYAESAMDEHLRLLRGWVRRCLPPIANALAEVRNPGAHSSVVDRATATEWHERMIGVGCEGDLLALARVKLR